MERNEGLEPGPYEEPTVGSGRRAGVPASPRRHAAPRPGRRSGKTGGSHRADAARPGVKVAVPAVAAMLAVGGTCLVLIRPGSDAEQTLVADLAAPRRPAPIASVTSTPSSTWHSPRRHKPSPTPTASQQQDDRHSPSPTSSPAERSHTAQKATPRGPSGAGRDTVPGRSGAATGTAAEFARKVVDLVNAQRAQHGCAPLTVDPHVQTAAQAHSDDMAARNYYAHETPEGVDPGTRMTNAGFHWQSWAENIFKSPQDPATAVDGWMKSPGHRANILNCSYKSTGVGVNLSPNGPWWTQDFATGF
ncbi:CAP domain-containing protein [Streptomyces sp. S186]|uniref:CAP domain-containing protein n=1 Tax=Streptomyces sp. S186 TaxID=3434395 RepID=UPI003F66F0E0